MTCFVTDVALMTLYGARVFTRGGDIYPVSSCAGLANKQRYKSDLRKKKRNQFKPWM